MNNRIIYITNLVSVEEYARLCRVTTRAIRVRIRNKRVSAARFGGFSFVDAEKSPPARRVSRHQKRLPGPATLPAGIDYRSLITPERFATGRKMRADRIYRAILTGKLKAVVAASMVFVSKVECENFLKTG